MIIRTLRFSYLFIISFCLNFSFFSTLLQAQTVPESDSLALVALYNSTNGDEWTRNDNWLKGPVSSWYGVTVANQKVERINLYNNNLLGYLPDEIGLFSGIIEISLSNNELSGELPSSIAILSTLESFYINGNQFNGAFPSFFNSLPRIAYMGISNNNFTSLPDLTHIIESAKSATNYVIPYLDVGSNNLSFDDLIPNLAIKENGVFIYDYQKPLKLDTIMYTQVGDKFYLPLEIDENLVDNEYTWHKNNAVYLTTNKNYFSIDEFTATDTGHYYCAISNPKIEDFTLYVSVTLREKIPQKVLEADSLALVVLYNSTNGNNWKRKDNWLTQPVYEWYGLHVRDGRVTEIRLNNNHLDGPLPKEITELTALQILNLGGNHLTGTLSNEVNKLSNLKWLYLSHNYISGSIPREIGELTKLERLMIYTNQLQGSIPEEIGNLQSLTSLNLGRNKLSGNIPRELTKLTKLTVIALDNNLLSGNIPDEIAQLNNLIFLGLGKNNLNTTIPISIIKKIPRVEVGANKFTFDKIIPAREAALKAGTKFRYSPQDTIGIKKTLYISLNTEFTIDLGLDSTIADNIYYWYKDGIAIDTTSVNKFTFEPILPSDAGTYTCEVTNPQVPDLTLQIAPITINVVSSEGRTVPESDSLALVALYNSTDGDNWTRNDNWLKGPVSTWYGISINKSRVTAIDLSDNSLNGQIAKEIGNLSHLQILHLPDNQLKGEIPAAIGHFSELFSLRLSDNSLSGKIPAEIGNLKNLYDLYLGWNQIEGSIPPEIGKLQNLNYLNLTDNNLTGTIPAEIGNLKQLKSLGLSGNQIEGNIPPEIGNLEALEELSLAGNKLSGSIPDEIGKLSHLKFITLYSNRLSGSVPPGIGNLSNLTELWLGYNELSGIPPEIGNLSNLEKLNFFNNQIKNIPGEIWELSKLRELFLSNNQLTGPIPPEISKLTKLSILGLSGNQLSGHIPSELGALSELKYLYLNNNQLSGDLPQSISKLSNLAVIQINNNAIQKLPDLTSANWKPKLFAENNQLTFDDILPNLSISDLSYFTYSPQDSIGQTKTIPLKTGESFTIDLGIDSTLTTNEYRWFKDSVEIAVTNQNSFTIAAVTPSDAGVYTCEVTNPAVDSLTLYSRPVTLIVKAEPMLQTITLDPIPDKTLGDAPFELFASASSGLPVSFTVEGPALLDGTTLTLTDTGKVSITAAQPGNENYLPAEEVVRSFVVKEATFSLSGKVKTQAGDPVGSGAVVLYTPNEADRLTTFQTGVLQTDGSYAFINLPVGEYSVGVIPDDPALLATYLGDVVIRSEATLISLTQSTEDQNITITSQPGTSTGNATVSGILILEESDGGSRILTGAAAMEGTPLPEVTVYLLSATGDVVATDITDAAGSFSFANIPTGSYIFKADYEGMPHDADNFSIEVSNQDMEVTALVAREGIIRLQEVSVVTGTTDEITRAPVLLYPNPTEGKFSILLDAHWIGGSLDIHSMSGQTIVQKPIHSSVLSFDLSPEKAGVYVITLQKGESWQILRVNKF